MKVHNFSVIIEKDKDGYFAFCPKLQGCYSQGDTYEEALKNIKDAVKLHMEDIIQSKESLPNKIDSISLSTIEVAV
jgi:predicted RNase H-like HicB family nuclease